MWKKYIKPALKILLIILLITTILSFFRSCSASVGGLFGDKPLFTVKLPNNKFTDFLARLADLIPGGFIGIPDYDAEGGSGDGTDNGTDDSTDNGSDEGTDDGTDDGSDDGTDDTNTEAHKCDDTLESRVGKPATCTTTGVNPYFECTDCGKIYDSNMNELTSEDLSIPIDPSRHDWEYIADEEYSTHTKVCKLNNTHTVPSEECTSTEEWRYNAEEHYKCCIYCLDVKLSEAHEKESPEDDFCAVCGMEFNESDSGEGGDSGDNLEEVEPEEPELTPEELDYYESFGDIYEDNPIVEEIIDEEYGIYEQKIMVDIPYLQESPDDVPASVLGEQNISFYNNSDVFVSVNMGGKMISRIELVFKDVDVIDAFIENACITLSDGETPVELFGYNVVDNTVTLYFYTIDSPEGYDYSVTNLIITCEGYTVDDLKYFNVYTDQLNS